MTRPLRWLLIVALLAGAGVLGLGRADAQAYTPVFDSTPCVFPIPPGLEEGRDLECGVLLVPENRDAPDTRTLRLPVVIAHPGPNPSPDPIIFLEGGPGGSVMRGMPGVLSLFMQAAAANRDLIFFDQRGVGLAEPALECPDVLQTYIDLLDREHDGQALDRAAMDALLVETAADCADVLRDAADLSQYTTANSAADIEALRIALGYDQVNLWGVSYGTRLALAMMRDYPDSIRSAVLDSVLPVQVNPLEAMPAQVDAAFERVFTGCAASPVCAEAYPDLRAVFYDTMAQLAAEPVTITAAYGRDPAPRSLVIDDAMLAGHVFNTLYDTEYLRYLPSQIYAIAGGSYLPLITSMGDSLATWQVTSLGMMWAVRCHDELAFDDPAVIAAEQAQYPALANYFASDLPQQAFCDVLDVGAAPSTANEPVVSAIPTLLLAGEYDPVTPADWALTAAETLTDSYVVTFPGVGHGAMFSDDCAYDMGIAFFVDPSAPPDTSCIVTSRPWWAVR